MHTKKLNEFSYGYDILTVDMPIADVIVLALFTVWSAHICL